MATGLISMEGTDVGFLLMLRASVFVAMGQFRRGIEGYEQALEVQSTDHARSLTGPYLALARSLRLIDETTAATSAARDAVEIDPYGGGGYYWLARTLLDVDRIVDAEKVLSTMTLLFRDSESPIASFWKEMLAAEILLFRSEPAEARAALERAADRPPEYRDRATEARLRARVLEALGDRPGAIAAYLEVLDPPYLLASEQWSPWTDWPVQQTEVLYPLARLEQAEGRIDDARRHYSAYLERWGEADVPVIGVKDARKQLQILEHD
jgi:tetratricopeptide (TPR) repeat protein